MFDPDSTIEVSALKLPARLKVVFEAFDRVTHIAKRPPSHILLFHKDYILLKSFVERRTEYKKPTIERARYRGYAFMTTAA